MDRLRKMISENGEALIYAIDATHAVQESMERLKSFPPATVHLGQAMMSALLLQAMGADKAGAETVALEWFCDGPFGHLFAEAKNYGEARGTIAQPRAPVTDYDTGLGQGQLRVRRSRGVSSTSLVIAKGNVVTDTLEYLENSEQRQAGINLCVQIEWRDPDDMEKGFRIERAIGYMVDILPQTTEQKVKDALVRWDRRMREIPQMSRWSLSEDRVESILQLVSGEPSPRVLLEQRVAFACHCNQERAERALALADAEEQKKTEKAEIRCEYCGKVYVI